MVDANQETVLYMSIQCLPQEEALLCRYSMGSAHLEWQEGLCLNGKGVKPEVVEIG